MTTMPNLRESHMSERLYSHDAEASVIGCLLLDQSLMAECLLEQGNFNSQPHQRIFAACQAMFLRKMPIDLLTLQDELGRREQLDLVGGLAYLVEIAKNTPSAANFTTYQTIVLERYRLRTTYLMLREALPRLERGENVSDELAASLLRIAQPSGKYEHGPEDIARAAVDAIELYQTGQAQGVTYGIPALDETTNGAHNSDLVIIAARPAMGKEQPLHSKILLDNGQWTTMEEIRIGDRLASVDGQASVVTGIYPQGVKRTYRVTFTDGRSTECGIDHLWTIRSSKFAGDKTVTTAKLIDMLSRERYQRRITVPGVSGDFGSAPSIGIDPWLLGVLLGDGGLTGSTPRISCTEKYIIDRVSAALPDGISLTHDSGPDYRLSGIKGKKNPVTSALIALGAYGAASAEKSIPGVVMSASRAVREGVLAGLLETDGWCEKFNSMLFSSASKELAEGVQSLVRSLGGYAKIRVRTNVTFTHNGETRCGLDCYQVGIRLADTSILQSPRLLANLAPNRKSCVPYIERIVESGEAECQCITVSHTSHLYVTDDYIVTHNTALLLNMILGALASPHGYSLGFVSAEMPVAQIGTRICCMDGRVSSHKMRAGTLDDEDWSRLTVATGRLVGSKLRVFDKSGVSITEIERIARRWKHEHGLSALYVDYLQRIKGVNPNAERWQQVGDNVMRLKELARELEIPVICLAQVNRACEERGNKRPGMGDIANSSEVEKEADQIMTIYRDDVYNENSTERGIAEINYVKNRHGPTGVVRTRWEAPFMRFCSLKEDY